VGCLDYRVVSKRRLTLDNPDIQRRAGMIDFYSMTIRAFKLDLEDLCEDYGQVAYYQGTIPESPHEFVLDDHHVFRTGQPLLVCGNTAAMVADTRYGAHFKVVGDRSVHYGPFDCSPTLAGASTTSIAPTTSSAPATGSCC
jgi:arsenite methyltransferase